MEEERGVARGTAAEVVQAGDVVAVKCDDEDRTARRDYRLVKCVGPLRVADGGEEIMDSDQRLVACGMRYLVGHPLTYFAERPVQAGEAGERTAAGGGRRGRATTTKAVYLMDETRTVFALSHQVYTTGVQVVTSGASGWELAEGEHERIMGCVS
jgi:hypothetical protein